MPWSLFPTTCCIQFPSLQISLQIAGGQIKIVCCIMYARPMQVWTLSCVRIMVCMYLCDIGHQGPSAGGLSVSCFDIIYKAMVLSSLSCPALVL